MKILGKKYLEGKKFLNLFLLVAIVVSLVSLNWIQAGARNVIQETEEVPSLKIVQGESLYYRISAKDILEFNLNVAEPEQGMSYFWSVEILPRLGQATIEGTGHEIPVKYIPNPNASGEDNFSVLLSNNKGEQARIMVLVSIEELPDLEIPDSPSRNMPDKPEIQKEYDSPFNSPDNRATSEGPWMEVDLTYSNVSGYDWSPNTEVTITIGTNQWTTTASEWGSAYFYLDSDDIQPGQVVEMTDGKTTLTHTIADLSITTIDVDKDLISGTSEPNAALYYIEAYDQDTSNWFDKTLTADSSGNWQVDFPSDFDLSPGDDGSVQHCDESENCTVLHWRVRDPHFVVSLTYNRVYGYEFTPRSAVMLKIDNYRWSQRADDDGRVTFYPSPLELQPGQVLLMTDGMSTETHTVADLAVTNVDQAQDKISGTADPNEEVFVWAYNENDENGESIYPTADSSGNWQVDFSGKVDIERGADGWVCQYDAEGNRTELRWFVPDPYILVRSQSTYAYGYDWIPSVDVTLTIDDQHWTATADEQGVIYFSTYPNVNEKGTVWTLTDGTHSVQYTVADLKISEVNEELEIIKGTADPNQEVRVSVRDKYDNYKALYLTADAQGHWEADFSVYMDIGPGTSMWAYQYDDEENATWDTDYIPDPWVYVNPQLDYVYGYSWVSGAEVTLTIDDDDQYTSTADDWGYVYFYLDGFDIEAGQVLKMTDGLSTLTHTVADLSVTNINQTQDILSGTADPNSEVDITAYDNNSEYYWAAFYYTVADDTGNWEAYFSGRIEIGPGVDGWVTHHDVPGSGTTEIHWYIPDPSFVVYPQRDVIYGSMWPANTEVTLEISGEQWTTTSSAYGNFWFNTDPFDILSNQEIILTGGGHTLTYTPWRIEITNVDYENDIITGIAQPPITTSARSTAEIEVNACDRFACISQNPPLDDSGNWEADFSGVIDISVGSRVTVTSDKEGGGKTIETWHFYGLYIPLIIK
jgi:hypothetical protein